MLWEKNNSPLCLYCSAFIEFVSLLYACLFITISSYAKAYLCSICFLPGSLVHDWKLTL